MVGLYVYNVENSYLVICSPGIVAREKSDPRKQSFRMALGDSDIITP